MVGWARPKLSLWGGGVKGQWRSGMLCRSGDEVARSDDGVQ